MNNGNGNGIDQRIKDAQRQLLKAQEPLQELDKKIATLQQQLAATQAAVATAEQEHDKAGSDYADDDSAANRKRLLGSAEDITAHRAKAKVLNDRIATLSAHRASLDSAVQRAHTVLSTVSNDVRIEVLEGEIATATYKIAQFEQGIFEWQKRLRTAKEEKLQLETGVREAAWRAQQPLMREKFLQANPHWRNERIVTRQGF